MLQHRAFRRAIGWTTRLLHPTDSAASPTDEAGAGQSAKQWPPTEMVPEAAASIPDLPPEPLEPRHRQGLLLAQRHDWNRAQRELELAVRATPDGPAAEDLASVRSACRQLRVLQKWPRDAQAHLALGRAYFELGLGADAEQALRQAIALAPAEPAGHLLLALEYAYRGSLAEAEQTYAEAQVRVAGLPDFAALLADLQATPAAEGPSAAAP